MPREPKPAKNSESGSDETPPCDKRSYYYDDAHGYEDFDPEKEPEDDDELAEEATS